MTGTLKQRETLAILIGWRRADSKQYGWINPQGGHEAIHGNTIRFNPFKNAEDDYEILRWFWSRSQSPADHTKFASSLKYGQLYKVGNYARAMLALKK